MSVLDSSASFADRRDAAFGEMTLVGVDKMRIEPSIPSDLSALRLLERLSKALAKITGDSGRNSFDPADVGGRGAQFVIANDHSGQAVGCGAYRPPSEEIAEVKRMFAAPGTRGVGRSILAFLEEKARSNGYLELWLETRVINDRAVHFYEKSGYSIIPNFGKYAGRRKAVCFPKTLSLLPEQ